MLKYHGQGFANGQTKMELSNDKYDCNYASRNHNLCFPEKGDKPVL